MFDRWSEKAQQLSVICDVSVSRLIEDVCTADERERGLDIADYMVRYSPAEFAAPQPAAEPPQCSREANAVQGLPDAAPCAHRGDTLPSHRGIIRKKWDDDIAKLEAFFDTATLPASPIILNAWTCIVDVKKCVEVSLAMAKANNGNDTFLPSLTRLKTLYERLNPNTSKL
jgi:hypothetical protein